MIPSGILLVLVVGVIGVIGNDPSNPTSRPLDPLMMRHSGYMKHDTGSSNHYNQTNSSDPSDTTGNLARARRNADPLSEYSHKLSTVARISNGISLLAGLINGNIPVDSVIQELLNFGDVKVQDVLALDKTKVDAALNELESAPSGIQSGLVESLEKEIVGFQNVKDTYKDVGDFSTYQIPTTYFDEIGNFKTDPTDMGVFNLMSTEAATALLKIEDIEKTGHVDDLNFTTPVTSIKTVRKNLKEIGAATGKLKKVVEAVDKFQGLSNPEETFKTLIQMLNALLIHRNINFAGRSEQSILDANFDKIRTLTTALDTAKTDLVNIGRLLSGLTHSSKTVRQFTPGFFKGASDLKLLTSDIRDPSVEQTIGTGKNFARLSGGLKPLETLSSKLSPVETKLRPISTLDTHHSTKNILNLVSLMTNLQLSSNDVTSALNDISTITFGKVDTGLTAPVDTLMENVVQLKTVLARMKSLAGDFPAPPPEVKQVKNILDALPDTFNKNHVSGTLHNFKAAGAKVTIVKTYLNDIKSKLESALNGVDVKQVATSIATGQQHLTAFLIEQRIKTATDGLNALSRIASPLESIAKGAQACRIIRNFKKDDITNIKSAVETISQASGLIREVQSVPNAMKKNQTEDVKELVTMKKSKETAMTLGFASGSIRNMDGLQGLQGSVLVLKNDKNFNTEVEKLADPKKSEIQRKYGDHNALVTALETSLQQINTFKSNLAVEKNLTKLGTPLTAATSVSDVTQNFKEKSDAIEMLISEVTDTQAKTNLQALKDHLDQLGALDLNFASGHTAFPQVPNALQGLFTFLTNFLTPKRATTAPAAAAGSGDEGGNMILFIGIGVAASVLMVLIGGAIFGGYYIRKKHNKDKKKSWKEIMYWVDRIYFTNLLSAAAFARDLRNEMQKEVGDELKTKKTEPEKMRYKILKLLEATAVNLPDGRFINANWINTQGEAKFIATQGPLTEKKKVKKKTKEEREKHKEPEFVYYKDTRADFIYMILTYESEFVVQLCQPEEEKETWQERELRLLEEEWRGVKNRKKIICEMSAKYYEEKAGYSMEVGGQYTVTTDTLEYLFDKAVEVRQLTIRDSKNPKLLHKLTHFCYTKWRNHEVVPGDVKPVVGIMEKVNKSKKPIVVLCASGCGRTVSFIGAEVIARDVERHPKKRTSEMFVPLRASRYKGITNALEAYFAVECALALLINEYAPKETEILEKHMKIFLQVREKMREEDEEERDRKREAEKAELEGEKEKPSTDSKNSASQEIEKPMKTSGNSADLLALLEYDRQEKEKRKLAKEKWEAKMAKKAKKPISKSAEKQVSKGDKAKEDKKSEKPEIPDDNVSFFDPNDPNDPRNQLEKH